MRFRLIALFIMFFAMFWGYKAHAAQINLSPVLLYESRVNWYSVNMLGPFFEFSSDRTAIRPLFYQDEYQTDILYPLGHSTENKALFFPLYSSVTNENHMHKNLFPLFYGKYQGKNYGGVFPLYGKLDHRFGYDKACFVLWPVYSATTIETAKTYYVLWPIFSYCRDKEFMIFPLYGYKKSLDSRRSFLIWPVFHRNRGTQNMDAMLPLFLYSRGASFKNFSFLWPFFTFSRDFTNRHFSMDIPWPLIRFASGGYEEATIFPFYRKKIISPTYSTKTVLWPLYRKEINYDKTGALRRVKTNILILSKHSQTFSLQGKKTVESTLWPVWHRRTTSNDSSWYFPWLFPFNSEGYKRNWLPLLTLAKGEHSEKSSVTDILWHILFYQREALSSRISFSFFCSYEKSPDYSQIGFLFDLLKLKIPHTS
jgi:hypothetical protein